MDQVTQEALAKYLKNKVYEKRVSQMTESELFELVTTACVQALVEHEEIVDHTNP